MKKCLVVLCSALLGCGSWPPKPPTEPTPPPPCEAGSCERSVEAPEQCNVVTGECVPCTPDLSAAIWNTDAGDVVCSTAERPVKHWPPDSECPVLTHACETEPPPEPPVEENQWFPIVPQDQITAARGNPGHMGSIVNKAMADLTGCFVGQEPCPVSVPVDIWFQAVCRQIHEGGFYCGRHVESPLGGLCPPGGGCSDQISVKRESFCDGGIHENYRVINPGENGVRWFPSAKLDAWNVDCTGATWPVDPTEPPVDPPPPTGVVCEDPELPWTDRDKYKLKCPGGDVGKWCDSVASVHGLDFCIAIGLGTMPGGNVPRWDCPVRAEGAFDRHDCESVFNGGKAGPPRDPIWTSDGEVELKPRPDGTLNRAMARTTGTWIRVCNADGVCGQVGP